MVCFYQILLHVMCCGTGTGLGLDLISTIQSIGLDSVLCWLGLGIVLVSNLSKIVSFCRFFSGQGFSFSSLDNNSVLS